MKFIEWIICVDWILNATNNIFVNLKSQIAQKETDKKKIMIDIIVHTYKISNSAHQTQRYISLILQMFLFLK